MGQAMRQVALFQFFIVFIAFSFPSNQTYANLPHMSRWSGCPVTPLAHPMETAQVCRNSRVTTMPMVSLFLGRHLAPIWNWNGTWLMALVFLKQNCRSLSPCWSCCLRICSSVDLRALEELTTAICGHCLEQLSRADPRWPQDPCESVFTYRATSALCTLEPWESSTNSTRNLWWFMQRFGGFSMAWSILCWEERLCQAQADVTPVQAKKTESEFATYRIWAVSWCQNLPKPRRSFLCGDNVVTQLILIVDAPSLDAHQMPMQRQLHTWGGLTKSWLPPC